MTTDNLSEFHISNKLESAANRVAFITSSVCAISKQKTSLEEICGFADIMLTIETDIREVQENHFRLELQRYEETARNQAEAKRAAESYLGEAQSVKPPAHE